MQVETGLLIAQGSATGITLLLAIAAFCAIRQTRKIGEAERRERILEDTARWAMEAHAISQEASSLSTKTKTIENAAKFEKLHTRTWYLVTWALYAHFLTEHLDTELHEKIEASRELLLGFNATLEESSRDFHRAEIIEKPASNVAGSCIYILHLIAGLRGDDIRTEGRKPIMKNFWSRLTGFRHDKN